MKQKKLYQYNPETDNFERFYPSIADRMKTAVMVLLLAVLLAVGVYFIIFYAFETPTVENLKARNQELRQQYVELDKRLGNSLKIMNEIQDRDSNFYRVLLQMDPMPVDSVNPSVLKLEQITSMQNMKDRELVNRLSNKIDTLDRALMHQAVSFNNIRNVIEYDKHKLDHIPGVLPLNIKDYTFASGYGIRIDPVYKSRKFHAGLDFAAKMGTPIFATADGKVEYADKKSGYGNVVDINHGYNYTTRYAHMEKILVKAGQNVKRGEMIGLVGSTGKSTGPHLHYEVRYKGEPQNPVNYYFMDLTPEEYADMIEMAENAGHVMD